MKTIATVLLKLYIISNSSKVLPYSNALIFLQYLNTVNKKKYVRVYNFYLHGQIRKYSRSSLFTFSNLIKFT